MVNPNIDVNSLSAHQDPPPLDEETKLKIHISSVLKESFGVKMNPREIEIRRDEIIDLLTKEGFKIPEEPTLEDIEHNLNRAAEEKRLGNTVIGTA